MSVTATGEMERYATGVFPKLFVGYTNGAMDCYVTTKRSKLRATHIIGDVTENLAGRDSYVSARDVDSATALPNWVTVRWFP